jgi:hypothetical protein
MTQATKAEIEALRLKIASLIAKFPDKAAILLTAWIHESNAAPKKRAG